MGDIDGRNTDGVERVENVHCKTCIFVDFLMRRFDIRGVWNIVGISLSVGSVYIHWVVRIKNINAAWIRYHVCNVLQLVYVDA